MMMKTKLFALVFLLMGTFAFANPTTESISVSEIENETKLFQKSYETNGFMVKSSEFEVFGTCYITLGFYDSDGNKVHEVVLAIEGVESAEQCDQIADDIASQL